MLIRGTTEIKSTCYTKEDNHRGKKRPMHSTFSLEIYSRIWSAALFPVTSPHPSVKVLRGWEGRGGGCLVVLETIFCEEFYTLCVTRFRTYKIAYPPQDNNPEGEGASIRYSNSCRKVLVQVTFNPKKFRIAFYESYYLSTNGEQRRIRRLILWKTKKLDFKNENDVRL
jgi:hypothetical protein